ncbi:MAG TPA: hypothetical protein VMW95_06715 [Desulfobacterales bacterium]|nr:hypothetical protein [Desulfobacterales bacterium]
MKLPKIKIPKFITGALITVAGALISAIPILAPAGAAMVKVGTVAMAVGLAAKGVRAVQEKSIKPSVIFKNEKALLGKVKKGGSK